MNQPLDLVDLRRLAEILRNTYRDGTVGFRMLEADQPLRPIGADTAEAAAQEIERLQATIRSMELDRERTRKLTRSRFLVVASTIISTLYRWLDVVVKSILTAVVVVAFVVVCVPACLVVGAWEWTWNRVGRKSP